MSETTSTSSGATERGGSQSDLRRYNERVVLGTIRTFPGTFNAELARRTGLAAQTISVILRSLDDQGLILRGPVLRGRRGQPATPISINPSGAFAIGAEIGWRHLSVVAINLAGDVLARRIAEYDHPDPETIASDVHEAIAALASELPRAVRTRVTGIGLAMPATLRHGLAPFTPGENVMGDWDGRAVAQQVEQLCGCPVHLMNDGSAACRAESIGRHTGWSNFAYLFVGTFIGAGFVLNGRVFDGPRGNAANLGSMIVPAGDGRAVTAHRAASLAALDHRLKAEGHPDLLRIAESWPWQQARPVVEAWLDEAAPVLAYVIANTSATIEFDRMVIDSALPPDLFALLMERVRQHVAEPEAANYALPEIVEGEVGIAAAAIGAASLPLYREYFQLENTQPENT